MIENFPFMLSVSKHSEIFFQQPARQHELLDDFVKRQERGQDHCII